MARSVRRRSAPSSPAQRRELTASPRQTRRSNRTLSREPQLARAKPERKQQPRLEAVNEHEDTITVNTGPSEDLTGALKNGPRDDFRDTDEEPETADSDSEATDSEEIAKLDKDLIIDNLEVINQDAQNLLSLINSDAITDSIRDLRDVSSKSGKRFGNFLRRLDNDLEPCGRGRKLFLVVPRLLRALSTDGLPTSGAQSVFLKANLAVLVAVLVSGPPTGQNESTRELLRHFTIQGTFPDTFIDTNTVSGVVDTGFEDATVALGVSILTQCFMKDAEELLANNDFNPDKYLNAIFADDEDNDRTMSMNPASQYAMLETRKAISKRIADITKYTSRNPSVVDLQGLRSKYSWKAFVEQAVAWAKATDALLEQQIDEHGGIEAVQSSLESIPAIIDPGSAKTRRMLRKSRESQILEEGTAFLRSIEDELDAAHQEESESEPESDVDSQEQEQRPEERPASDGLARTLFIPSKSPREQHRLTISESPQPARPTTNRARESEVDQNFEGGSFNDDRREQDFEAEQVQPAQTQQPAAWPLGPTQETLNVLEVAQRQERESNKENKPPHQRTRLLDRQAGAVRVDFDENSPRPSQGRRKRPRDPLWSSDEDDDDDFEEDTRQTKKPRQYKGKSTAQASSQPSKTARFADAIDNSDEQQEDTPRAPRRQAMVRHRSKSSSAQPESSTARWQSQRTHVTRPAPLTSHVTAPSSSAPLPASSQQAYAQVRREAQQNVRDATLAVATSTRGNAFRSTQVRVRWSEEETERLMELMQEFGTSWSKIKQADTRFVRHLLKDRNQVQLKDKARNIKLDFLKAERPLPDYLLYVTINKGHKDMLRRLGIALPPEIAEEDD